MNDFIWDDPLATVPLLYPMRAQVICSVTYCHCRTVTFHWCIAVRVTYSHCRTVTFHLVYSCPHINSRLAFCFTVWCSLDFNNFLLTCSDYFWGWCTPPQRCMGIRLLIYPLTCHWILICRLVAIDLLKSAGCHQALVNLCISSSARGVESSLARKHVSLCFGWGYF